MFSSSGFGYCASDSQKIILVHVSCEDMVHLKHVQTYLILSVRVAKFIV